MRSHAASRSVLFGTMTVVLACGGGAPERGGAEAALPPLAQSWDAGTVADAASDVDPRVQEAKLELDRLQAAESSFGALENPVLGTIGKSKIRKRGPIPFARVASVSAYAFGFNGKYEKPDCTVVDADGHPCGDVIGTGVTLNDAQSKRLLALLQPPAPSGSIHSARMRCDFDPHHAFVLRDAAGSPLATLEVCFTCGEWRALPAQTHLGGGTPEVMEETERSTMRQLCEESQLGGCFLGDDELMGKIAMLRREELQRRREQARRTPPAGPKLDANEKLSALDVREKQIACDWFAELADLYETGLEHGFECPDSPLTFGTLSTADCMTRFPRCDSTVAEAEKATRAFVSLDVCRGKPLDPIASCAWGITPSRRGP